MAVCKNMIFLILVFMLKCFIINAVILPSYFPTCHIDDSNLDNCILKAANFLKPYLKNGLKELNLLPLKPYIIPELKITDDRVESNFKIIYKNLTFNGIENYNATKAYFNKNNLTFFLQLEFEKVSYYTVADIIGRFFQFRLNGSGIINGTAEKVVKTFEVNGKIVNKSGLDYYNVEDVECTVSIDSLKQSIEGLAHNIEEERLMNKWFAENPKTTAKALIPLFQKIWEVAAYRYFDSLTKHVSYNLLFPSGGLMLITNIIS